MAYNPQNQYRCDFIRSRIINHLDNLLPVVANIVNKICPCSKPSFIQSFNAMSMPYLVALGLKPTQKTIDNLRTEIANKLFGLYYYDNYGIARATQRLSEFLRTNDQPAFFKEICYKYQEPNGISRSDRVTKRVNDGICVYPVRYILAVLNEAQNKGIDVSIREIGYYVLNAKDVLTMNASPMEVVKRIEADQSAGIINTIAKKNNSYEWQHIRALITYMMLANLILLKNKKNYGKDNIVILNTVELPAIRIFIRNYNSTPMDFDLKKYPRKTIAERRRFQFDWDEYNGHLRPYYADFATSPAALGLSGASTAKKYSASSFIGKTGEQYVIDMEKERLSKINAAYASMVLDKSAKKGTGYDIESIVGIGQNPKDPLYIEVKSTIRKTPLPASYIETINITRNEWKAAYTLRNNYWIYRVYFIIGAKKPEVHEIFGIYEKVNIRGLATIDATSFELSFDHSTEGLVDKIE